MNSSGRALFDGSYPFKTVRREFTRIRKALRTGNGKTCEAITFLMLKYISNRKGCFTTE